MSKRLMMHACTASALLAISTAALAQNTVTGTTADPGLNTTTTDPLGTNTADPLTTNTAPGDPLATDPMTTGTTTVPVVVDPVGMAPTQQEDDDAFPWGLLGLLGLAGLFGLKRRDRDDVYADRTDTRGTSNRL